MCCFLVVIVLLYSSLMLPPYMWQCIHVKHRFVLFKYGAYIEFTSQFYIITLHAKFSRPWVPYAQRVLVNVPLFFATLGEGEEEATCNADEGCWGSQESRGSPYARKWMQKYTHSPLHKKSLSHYSLDRFLLSLFFVCSFPPFIFFLHTYQVKRFWPSSTFPLNAQQH